MSQQGESRSDGHVQFLELQRARVRHIRECLDQWFPDPGGLVLEVGCGHGHYLTAFAQQHPDARCLGVDLVTKRIEKAGQKRDKRNLRNLQFLKAEVRELFMAWPERLLLERIFILFPDPWPKKRHIKNRIIQQALLEQLARFASPGAHLHFRTDHQGTFAWGLEQVTGSAHWRINEDSEWPLENPSYFQDLFIHYQSLTAVRN